MTAPNISTKVYIPRDSSSLSMGAEKVAVAIALEAKKRGLNIEVIRNGSRGLFWLETLVEVATDQGRVAYVVDDDQTDQKKRTKVLIGHLGTF